MASIRPILPASRKDSMSNRIRIPAVFSLTCSLIIVACGSGGGGGTGGTGGHATGLAGAGGSAQGGKGGAGGTNSAGVGGTNTAGAGGTNTSGGVCRPVAPCPSGWIPYNDTVCSPPIPDGGIHCSSNGDGLCYLACSTSTDCRAMGLNSCGSITFFHNNDYGTQVAVCDGTAQLPACSTPDAGSDDGG
jgi:hypothetical protein